MFSRRRKCDKTKGENTQKAQLKTIVYPREAVKNFPPNDYQSHKHEFVFVTKMQWSGNSFPN